MKVQYVVITIGIWVLSLNIPSVSQELQSVIDGQGIVALPPYLAPPEATPGTPVITIKAGPILVLPRGAFPDIVFNHQGHSTGEWNSEEAVTTIKHRYGIEVEALRARRRIGLSLGFSMIDWIVKYHNHSNGSALEFELQTAQLGIGLTTDLYTNWSSFRITPPRFGGETATGLRTIYLNTSVEVGLITIDNRVELTRTDSLGKQNTSIASFENNELLQTPVSLRASAGLRYAFSPHIELQVETGYSLALNKVFNGTALHNNGFSVDHLSIQLGIGYRFGLFVFGF